MPTRVPFGRRPRLVPLCLAVSVVVASPPGSADTMLPQPLTDADYLFNGAPPEDVVTLGRDLFFDPVLSGNRNISCGTCHDPAFGTGDGLALGIGEGGDGAGPDRHTSDPVSSRVPRNAPALWNVGAREQRVLFHDGRLEAFGSDARTFRIPAGAPLPEGLSSVLAAQAFFPVTSAVEMAGQRGENAVADALVSEGFAAGWAAIARRVADIEPYADRFVTAFPDISSPRDVEYRHIAEALAAFQSVAFRSDDSDFDTLLRTGDASHMSPEAQAGHELFYGKARCASCHSGALLTDHAFHAIAVPQIGPGKGQGRDPGYWEASGLMAFLEDEGRFGVTGDPGDLFAFRTPSLRNVVVSGPWGHSGAFDTLEGMVRHHLDATDSLDAYDPGTLLPELTRVMDQIDPEAPGGYSELTTGTRVAFDARDAWVQSSPDLRTRIADANTLDPLDLTDREVQQLLAFLGTLTDETALQRAARVPQTVPSGLRPQPAHGRSRPHREAGDLRPREY